MMGTMIRSKIQTFQKLTMDNNLSLRRDFQVLELEFYRLGTRAAKPESAIANRIVPPATAKPIG